MHRSVRIASAAVAAALTLGATGPAVSAHAAGSHAKDAKVAQVKVAKAAKAAAKDKRLALKDIARVNALLGKFASSVRTSKIGTAHKDAVLANVAADRAALTTLAESLQSAGATVTDLKQVRGELKTYRVSNYQVAVNLLRYADTLAAEIDALRAEVVEGSDEALTLDEAEGKVAEAVAGAHAVTATTSNVVLREIKALLSSASADVEAVEEALAAVPVEQPETPVEQPEAPIEAPAAPVEEPATGDPTVADPTVTDPAAGAPVTDPATV